MSVNADALKPEVASTMPRTLEQWRLQVLNGMLRGMLVFGAFALVGSGIIPTLQTNRIDLLVGYVVAYAVLVFVTFMHRLGFVLRAGVLLLLLYVLGTLDFSVAGLGGDGRIFLFAFITITTVLFDLRRGIGALVLSLLTMAIVAWLLITGQWVIPLQIEASSANLTDWISESIVLLLLSTSVIISVAYLLQGLERSLAASRQMVRELQEHQGNLEQLVKERTVNLERRAVQLQAAAEVARDATAARGLDDLLNRAVDLVRDRFGFYHAGIFLVDDRGDYAVLRAATGEAGRQMLERGHKLKVGEVGIVGYVTGSGQSHVALDIGADAVHFENPVLPDTRSEMALPLKVGERVIGALDVQSTRESAFDDDDVAVLQTMADQLAVAIQNARLLREMQQTVRELEAAYGRYTQESWHTFVQSAGRSYGYRYRNSGVEPITGQRPEAYEASRRSQTVLTSIPRSESTDKPAENGNGSEGSASAPRPAGASHLCRADRCRQGGLAVPLKLRDQVIGVVNLRFEDEAISPDTVSLVEEAADRLALVLENARLVQEAQGLALREQQINLISARARSSMNLEAILQNTVRELGRALGASRAFIQLGFEGHQETPAPPQVQVGEAGNSPV
jgi:GAF domain-containing protein